MSKAAAEVIPNVVGIEMAWVDPWNKPPVGTKLYTTDHAEALAKALAPFANYACDGETDPNHCQNCAARAVLINYREATGQN